MIEVFESIANSCSYRETRSGFAVPNKHKNEDDHNKSAALRIFFSVSMQLSSVSGSAYNAVQRCDFKFASQSSWIKLGRIEGREEVEGGGVGVGGGQRSSQAP